MFSPAPVAASSVLPFPDLAFEWDLSGAAHSVTVFTDTSLREATEQLHGQKVAWMLESPRATRDEYRWIAKNHGHFARVLTFERDLLCRLPNARFSPLGGCWLHRDDWQISEKSQNLSIIASSKRDMPGQILRHKVISRFGDEFDAILGRGYREIDNKIEGLKPFRYTLAIENCRQDFYFSEKLMDCFLSGTVPIYWGCPSIPVLFDAGGIIAFEKLKDLHRIVPSLGEADYAARLPAVRRNFEIAQRYIYPEAHLWENIRDLAVKEG